MRNARHKSPLMHYGAFFGRNYWPSKRGTSKRMNRITNCSLQPLLGERSRRFRFWAMQMSPIQFAPCGVPGQGSKALFHELSTYCQTMNGVDGGAFTFMDSLWPGLLLAGHHTPNSLYLYSSTETVWMKKVHYFKCITVDKINIFVSANVHTPI